MRTDRSAWWASAGTLFASAILSACLGFCASAGWWRPDCGVVLLGAAALFAFGGYRALEGWRESTANRQRLNEKIEEFQVRLSAQTAAVDDLADNLDLALFICDRRVVAHYANRRALELFRIEDYRERPLSVITLSHELEQLLRDVASTKEPSVKELTFTYPKDWIGIAKAWPGTDHRVYLSIYEITDLRRLERIRKDFVANVSHEMRTPMTIIRAMSETLLDDDDPELKERYLNKIMAEVDRLSMISQDLLVLSASESNPVRKQSCDLAGILRDAVNQLGPKARDKGLHLDYAGPQKLTVEANPAQMIQVALNLVDNAINYTPDGCVRVDLRSDAGEAIFQVRDSGIGIASEHLERVFERFYRVDKARSRFTGGTGLGLSIVKHIVEAHGGQIQVESKLNEGSIFTVRLPITGSSS